MDSRGNFVVSDGILSAVGSTPLVRLRRLLAGSQVEVFAKLEGLNPGGSIKDRPAIEILGAALAAGVVGPETVVVESSSGNMGIGLAQACRFHHLRFICVVDAKTSEQNLKVMRAYGTEIVEVREPDPVSGEFLQARLARVRQLLDAIPGAFWPNQYENLHNSGSHYRTTMHEVAQALDGRVDYLFIATSTCGTIRGCGEYIRDHAMPTRVIAVDARGSRIFGDEPGKRMVPGLGAGLRPPLCAPSLIDEVIHVSDLDCVIGCRLLLEREAILAGGSSGAVVSALERCCARFPAGASCVILLPDRGERYLDTIYSEAWTEEHCGKLTTLPEGSAETVAAQALEEPPRDAGRVVGGGGRWRA
jgi:2,3-diaminopropionate biosynthesis protein SbnA